MSSQSDQYRRLFSGTLGVLPIVFPNRALGGTLVHFLRDLPMSKPATSKLSSSKVLLGPIMNTKWPQPSACLALKLYTTGYTFIQRQLFSLARKLASKTSKQ